MLRKLSIAIVAGAASVLLSGGMAIAADESCFPSAADECGPATGTTPTTQYDPSAVGSTMSGAATGTSGTLQPVEIQTPGSQSGPLVDD